VSLIFRALTTQRELGVDHAHVLGVSVGGSSIAFHLAQQYHDSVLSLTMISPHMPVEHPEWTLAFDEIAEVSTTSNLRAALMSAPRASGEREGC